MKIFCPNETIGAVAGALGARAQMGEIGAGLRLGEIHRRRPFAGDHLRQIDGFQRLARMRSPSPLSRPGRAAGTARRRYWRRSRSPCRRRRAAAAGPCRHGRAARRARSSRPRPRAHRPRASPARSSPRRPRSVTAARSPIAIERQQRALGEFGGLLERRGGGRPHRDRHRARPARRPPRPPPAAWRRADRREARGRASGTPRENRFLILAPPQRYSTDATKQGRFSAPRPGAAPRRFAGQEYSPDRNKCSRAAQRPAAPYRRRTTG